MELSMQLREKSIDRIGKAIALARRNGVDELTLEHAEKRHIELAAMEQVDLASLQEQRNEGADLKTLCVVFNDAMLDRLRAAVRAAEEIQVDPKGLEEAKEVISVVQLRMDLE